MVQPGFPNPGVTGATSQEIRTAACFCRPSGYHPDFHALATDALIVFPWDRKVIEEGELVVHPTYRGVVEE